jgi:hypothetical protein
MKTELCTCGREVTVGSKPLQTTYFKGRRSSNIEELYLTKDTAVSVHSMSGLQRTGVNGFYFIGNPREHLLTVFLVGSGLKNDLA